MTNRLAALRPLMEAENLDALLCSSDVARYYMTGFPSSAGMALILWEKSYFWTDFRYFELAQREVSGYDIAMVTREKPYKELLRQALEAHGARRVGFEADAMFVSQHTRLREALPVEMIPADKLLNTLRAVKDDHELALMQEAQRIAERALESVLPLIKPGVSEKHICAELIYHMLREGADKVSFDPIVVAGPNSSLPHGHPGDRPIARGDFVTMDFGCMYKGYCSDMTRTVAVGEATAEMRKVYEIVLRAQEAGSAAARGGVVGSTIDAVARKVIEDEGYGEYFGHGFGHGIGLEVHEDYCAGSSEEKILPVGAVISAEPGIYLPGRFGVRIEDVVALTKTGVINLTRAPKELLIL